MMIDLYKIKEELEALIIDGEIIINNGEIYWYFEDSLEDQDLLWTVYCDNANIIRNAGYEIENNWQDNDSCGFDIVECS